MIGYVDIAANDETENIFDIVCFTYVPYTPWEDVKLYGNQSASGDIVCNEIFTYTERHKSRLYVEKLKNKNCYCVNDHSGY